MQVTDILNIARGEIDSPGSCENPMGSNCGTKYHAAFGMQNAQWCAIFVWYLFRSNPQLIHNLHSAYSGDYLNAGRNHGEEVSVEQAGPGDIFIADYGDGGITDHIGIIEKRLGATTFQTIEGNTGDCVKRRVRTHGPDYFMWFIRPKYSQPTEEDDEMAVLANGKAVKGGGPDNDFNLILNIDMHPESAIKIYNGGPKDSAVTVGVAEERYNFTLAPNKTWINRLKDKAGGAAGDVVVFVSAKDNTVNVTVE